MHNILNLPQNVIYDNFIVTADTFVSAVCSCICIHLVTMPRNKKTKKTKEEYKEIITTLENEISKKIANKQLELHFNKYQSEKIRLEALQERINRKYAAGSEYKLRFRHAI